MGRNEEAIKVSTAKALKRNPKNDEAGDPADGGGRRCNE